MCTDLGRRARPIGLALAATMSLFGCHGSTEPSGSRVDPLVGGGGFGFAVGSSFVGAAAPHGLAKAGPDTSGPTFGAIGFLHCSGYWFGDDTLQGFSNLHLHGTGLPDLGALGIMPIPRFDGSQRSKTAYQSKLDKGSEQASPGYYAVRVENGDILTEITATARAAHYRIGYGGDGDLVVDLDHSLDGGKVAMGALSLGDDGASLSGQLLVQGDMSGHYGGVTVYFVLRSKTPWQGAQLWSSSTPPSTMTSVSGSGVGADLHFASSSAPVEVQIGLSLTSIDAARANLAAEMPSFDFDGTRAATAAAWQALIDRVEISGGSAAHQRAFFASMYHLFLMPTDITDVDGRYMGFDGAIHGPDAFRFVSDLSLWDTYRTLHPLYAIVAPEDARAAVRSLIAMADQSGAFPKWPLATGETGVMLGASAEVVLADAYVKGVTDFDAERAYQTLLAAATDPNAPASSRGGRDDVVPYMDYGYVTSEKGGSVSKTTEYAYDDFALGNLAAALGHDGDATMLHERAHSYRALFDPATGFLRGRDRAGQLAASSFDPTAFIDDYVEANAWQSTWYAAHDVDGLAALLGGRAAMIDKLTTFFEQAKTDWDSIDPKDTLRKAAQRPYYWGGNEPDIQAPYLFAQAGRPDLTQKWVRWAMDTLYGDGPDGLPGNDDGGAMSAWYVFSAMSLYPIAGSDQYVVGAPRFPHMVVQLPDGLFTIDAPAVSDANLYVQSVTLDGAPLTTPALTHADLHAGGNLTFVMGPTPSSWGQ